MMAEHDRTKQLASLSKLLHHIDLVFEKYKLPPAVAECLDDADDAVRAAIRELGVDWGEKLERWEQGEPKGKE